jgi:hypothetical protein
MIDFARESDTGTDQYSTSGTDTQSIAANGTSTNSQSHNDKDSGVEDIISSDQGVTGLSEVLPDGTQVAGGDTFGDTSDDQSDYRDSDVESASTTDNFSDHKDDNDVFGSNDNANMLLTSAALGGALTTVTVSRASSDNGTDDSKDDLTDTETLPTATSGETDSFTFDDSDNVQDQASGATQIVVAALGFLTPSSYSNSTETVMIAANTGGSSWVDDPGTETDAASGDTESDKQTAHADGNDTVNTSDALASIAIVMDPYGGITSTQVTDSGTDALTGKSTEDSSDQRGETLNGSGESDSDHLKSDDSSGDVANGGGFQTVVTNILRPVANGLLVTTSVQASQDGEVASETADDAVTRDSRRRASAREPSPTG